MTEITPAHRAAVAEAIRELFTDARAWLRNKHESTAMKPAPKQAL